MKQRIAIVGEFWSGDEANIGIPFVDSAGRELNRMLEEAGIDRTDCVALTVFPRQPPGKADVSNFCTDKKSSSVPMPELLKGKYLQDQYWPDVQALYTELKAAQPNIVIALGNAALWALTGDYGIKKLRGTITQATLGVPGLKVLPVFSPRSIFADWSMRPVAVADLMKAKRQSAFPEIRRPQREIWLEPSLNHIELFFNSYVKNCSKLSFDIETAGATQITCIGFAPDPTRCIVIPFVDNRQPDGSFWRSLEEERSAWRWVARYLDTPAEKVGQNTLYDINWLWTKVGIIPRNYSRDTMLKHHAINPELEKGLGFLGSIYTDEPAWKTMRGKGMFTIKRGE